MHTKGHTHSEGQTQEDIHTHGHKHTEGYTKRARTQRDKYKHTTIHRGTHIG